MQTLPNHGLYNEWDRLNLQMSWDSGRPLARSFIAVAAICDTLTACVAGESSGWRSRRKSPSAVDPWWSAADSP